jgi:two-component system, cell cycle response regulator DivK
MGVILVVEDNEANQMLTRVVLELEGHRVLVASSGSEAMAVVQDEPPDLILMDVQLPGEDGLSITRALKASAATAEIPVVALTAHAMSGDRELALHAGCAGYIAKPIDTRTFGETVLQYMRIGGRDRGMVTT